MSTSRTRILIPINFSCPFRSMLKLIKSQFTLGRWLFATDAVLSQERLCMSASVGSMSGWEETFLKFSLFLWTWKWNRKGFKYRLLKLFKNIFLTPYIVCKCMYAVKNLWVAQKAKRVLRERWKSVERLLREGQLLTHWWIFFQEILIFILGDFFLEKSVKS